MIKIKYKPSFVRQYKKLPNDLQQEVKEKINLFRIDPYHSFLKTHKLKGRLAGRWSFSVNYSYRIIFKYISKTAVDFLDVGKYEIYS